MRHILFVLFDLEALEALYKPFANYNIRRASKPQALYTKATRL